MHTPRSPAALSLGPRESDCALFGQGGGRCAGGRGRAAGTAHRGPPGPRAVCNIYPYATGILIVLILFRGGMVWWYYKWYLIV